MSLRDVSGYPFAIAVCTVLLLTLAWLLRSQRLREKYSVIWLVLVLGLVVLGFVPQLTQWLTRLTGVTTPINLVFILASLALLVVCLQLSLELSRLEETTRTVAEEIALLRLEVDQRLAGTGQVGPSPGGEVPLAAERGTGDPGPDPHPGEPPGHPPGPGRAAPGRQGAVGGA